MSKAIAEQSNAISIFWFNKNNCFIPKRFGGGFRSGTITWTSGENKNSISYDFITNKQFDTNEENYIRLYYTHTDYRTEEKSEMDFKVPITTTPCNYGGVRYWFICPLTKNGKYCGRRVGVIYKIGKWFGCRHCGEIVYDSQMQSERYKGFVSIPDIEKAEKEVKRYYYKDKPTRKYRKVMRLNEKFENGLLKSYSRLVGLKK